MANAKRKRDEADDVKSQRATNKLIAIHLKTLASGMHGDGAGLWLQVTRDGAGRSWIFRYTFNGKAREMGLGSLNTVGLAKARDAAMECRQLLTGTPTKAPVDPIEHRRKLRIDAQLQAEKSKTFRQCADAYIATHRAGWRNAKHAAQWASTLSAYVYPVFGDLPIDAVDTGLVIKVLEPIWTAKPETASRVRGRIEAILDWGRTAGYREGDNPARWRGHLANLLVGKSKAAKAARRARGKTEHHAALPYREMGGFMATLRHQKSTAASALEFLILTAGRTDEVLRARWGEFDLADKVWTVPAERMKNEKPHRVPLSAAALTVIERLAVNRNCDFVFPGATPGRPLSNMALLMLLRRMGQGGVTVHGFRSTFRDWVGDCTSFPSDIAELALAHTVADKVEAAYRRSDGFVKRRELASDWAIYCGVSDAASAATALG